jgi:uracil-DNA glycosylase family 4
MAHTEGDTRAELLALVRSLRAQIQCDIDEGKSPSYLCMKGDIPRKERPLRNNLSVESHMAVRTAETLEDVKQELGDCQRCSLGRLRTNLVFGEGNPKSGLVFVGEAPGGDEDIQGRPFVGRAGQLLTRIVEAMGLKRKDVYICNPRPDEINACEPFLIKQLKVIKPQVICALGTFASHTLLKTDVPITVLRGKFHAYQGIQLMPTYHPAYLLRNPGAKKQVWEDVQKIMRLLSPQTL